MLKGRIGSQYESSHAARGLRVVVIAVSSLLLLLGLVAPAGAALIRALPRSARIVPGRLIAFGPAPSAGLGRKLGRASSNHQLVVLVFHKTASPTQWATVRSWLSSNGIGSTKVGNALKVVASTERLGRLFHTSFADYSDPTGSVLAATSRPLVPEDVAAALAGILGLSNAPVVIPNYAIVPGSQHPWTPPAGDIARPDGGTVTPTACSAATAETSSAPGAMTEVQVGAHYGVNQLQAAGYEGSGVTIAVFESADVSMSDVQAYDTCFGLNPANVSVVNVDGGGTSTNIAEADADVEQLQTQAPLAHIEVFQGPNNLAGIYLTWQAIADASPMPQIVSSSWGMCTSAVASSDPGEILSLDALLSQMASSGQSVFQASGDFGSEDCMYETYDSSTNTWNWFNTTTLGTQYPAVDPNVTAVGGTVPQSSGSDVVWNGCSTGPATCFTGGSPLTGPGSFGAGGGGVTSQFPEPSWQDSAGTFSGRAFPDVAADADNQVNYVSGDWVIGGGTSLAAPLLAGMFADVLPTYASGPNGLSGLGNVAPGFYKDVAEFGYGSAVTAVTSGNNDFTDAFNHQK
ncbi:MAG: S53 family peptidase, partial [Actinomycetota bacterium]|nr:S53 family peptidase [Actinomycetota bacterium]